MPDRITHPAYPATGAHQHDKIDQIHHQPMRGDLLLFGAGYDDRHNRSTGL